MRKIALVAVLGVAACVTSPESYGPTIRVTAAQGSHNALGTENVRTDGSGPSESGRLAARRILTACGDGEIVRQNAAVTESRVAPARVD